MGAGLEVLLCSQQMVLKPIANWWPTSNVYLCLMNILRKESHDQYGFLTAYMDRSGERDLG